MKENDVCYLERKRDDGDVIPVLQHFYIAAEKAIGSRDLNLPSIVVAGNQLLCKDCILINLSEYGHMTGFGQWNVTGSIFFWAKMLKGDLDLCSLFVAVWEAKCGR